MIGYSEFILEEIDSDEYIIHINDVCNLVDEQIKKIRKINNKLFNVGGGPKNTISLKELTKK